MEASAGDLGAGRRALERARWGEARQAFRAALVDGESAEARDGLGLALWFLGDAADGIHERERAVDLYAGDDRLDDAARTAVWVSHQHALGHRTSAARGWLARAERLLDGVEECAGHGWVAVERARHSVDPEQQAVHAWQAVAVARRTRAPDLETFALSVAGRARVEAGCSEEGMLLLEEAMAGAVGGSVRNLHTLAEAYCNLIIASTGAGDWSRATEWCEHVDAFARDHEAAPLFATCRGVHADVLVATGHWDHAESALRTALATHADHVPEMAGPAIASLAALRVHQGRLSEAEALLTGREESPASLRALALLRLAEGRSDAAASLLERALLQPPGGVVMAADLRTLLVRARLACGDPAGAALAATALTVLAADSGVGVVLAQAQLARAQVDLADGVAGQASERSRRALTTFQSLGMPLEAGTARLALARALATTHPDLAADEARVALLAFEQLGAVGAAVSARTLLRSWGRGAVTTGGLSPREQEVLELVARGLPNAAIASRLVISEKTVGHHVSHILTKLGVHNRTEAAAHVRDGRT